MISWCPLIRFTYSGEPNSVSTTRAERFKSSSVSNKGTTRISGYTPASISRGEEEGGEGRVGRVGKVGGWGRWEGVKGGVRVGVRVWRWGREGEGVRVRVKSRVRVRVGGEG
jgi:hypothetical protein